MSEHHKLIQQAALSITSKFTNGCRSTPSNANVNLLKVDYSLNKGRELAFRRVYVRVSDSGAMSTIGWIVPYDISYCMICASTFGYTLSKFNCTACGNVVCSSCTTSSSYLSDITFPKPVTVCSQCCWGQEIVDIAPNIELGLPLYIRDLPSLYGPCTLSPITPVRVLKSRRAVGNCHVFINLCTSPLVPLNHNLTGGCSAHRRNSIEQQIVDKTSFYYLVCGPESFGVGGVYVYDVAVHPKVLAQPSPDEQPPVSHADLSSFFEQVLRLVERVSHEPISDAYITHSQCTYYRPQLSQVDNQRMANELDPTLGQITLPIPTLEAFRDLYQIGVKPSDVRTSSVGNSNSSSSSSGGGSGAVTAIAARRNSKTAAYIAGSTGPTGPSGATSATTSATATRTPVVLGEVHTANGNRIRSPSVTSISSIPVTPFDHHTASSGIDRLIASARSPAAGSTGGESSSSDEESSSSQASHSGKGHSGKRRDGSGGKYTFQPHHPVRKHSLLLGERVPTNEGRELISADMLVHSKERDIDGRSVNMLKAQAVRVPRSLVGWQIALLSPEMKSTGIYVVTGIRKSPLFKSEYRLSNFVLDDQWVLLKRSPTKKGHNFQPLRKVFTPPGSGGVSSGSSVVSQSSASRI